MCLCLCVHLCHMLVEVRGQLVTASALLLWVWEVIPFCWSLQSSFFFFKLMLFCKRLSQISVAVVKYHDQKQRGEERVYVSIQFHTVVHHRQELKQKPRECSCWLACSALLSSTIQDDLLRGGTTHNGLGLLHRSVIQTVNCNLSVRPIFWRRFSQLRFLLPRDIQVCVKLADPPAQCTPVRMLKGLER